MTVPPVVLVPILPARSPAATPVMQTIRSMEVFVPLAGSCPDRLPQPFHDALSRLLLSSAPPLLLIFDGATRRKSIQRFPT